MIIVSSANAVLDASSYTSGAYYLFVLAIDNANNRTEVFRSDLFVKGIF